MNLFHKVLSTQNDLYSSHSSMLYKEEGGGVSKSESSYLKEEQSTLCVLSNNSSVSLPSSALQTASVLLLSPHCSVS